MMITPFEKLKSLPDAECYLKSGISFEGLGELAHRISDNEAAGRMQQAKNELFDTIDERERRKGPNQTVRTASA